MHNLDPDLPPLQTVKVVPLTLDLDPYILLLLTVFSISNEIHPLTLHDTGKDPVLL